MIASECRLLASAAHRAVDSRSVRTFQVHRSRQDVTSNLKIEGDRECNRSCDIDTIIGDKPDSVPTGIAAVCRVPVWDLQHIAAPAARDSKLERPLLVVNEG